jgi:ABC-type transporter Mla MlaB component
MSKDGAGGGFFSRVAKLVKLPAGGWTGQEGELPGAGTEQDRQALKEAIERKRRNDFVRKRELDTLRALRRQAQAAQPADKPSLFHSSHSDKSDGREKTIEKIDAIEAQMAQNWWRDKGGPNTASHRLKIDDRVALRQQERLATPGHLQLRQPGTDWGDSLPARAGPPTATQPMSHGPAATPSQPSAWREEALPIRFGDSHPPATRPPAETTLPGADLDTLQEAALAYAKGDDAQADKCLRQAMDRQGGTPVGHLAWLALLEWCRVRQNEAEFHRLSREYAERFGGPVPPWTPWPQPWVAPTLVALAPDAPTAKWRCPAVLDVTAVQALAQAVESAAGARLLDWSALEAADLHAGQLLLERLEVWAREPGDWQFVGSAVLRRKLKASTPSGRRENDPLWWRLRLAALRLMQRHEEFELTALDFCVTYGVMPPDWQPPQCRYKALDSLPQDSASQTNESNEPSPSNLMALEWPSMASDTQIAGVATTPPVDAAQALVLPLSGECVGDISATLRHWQGELDASAPGQPVLIDCEPLVRIDFAAASYLLQWLLSALAAGHRPELVRVPRLIAAFLHVVGVDETVALRLRSF